MQFWSHKKCTKCKILREIREFYKDNRHRDGKTSRCKYCSVNSVKLRYKNNLSYKNSHKISMAKYQKSLKGKISSKNINHTYNRKRKLIIVNHYSGGTNYCDCCGEKHIEFLSIDHIGGGGSKHRKTIKKEGSSLYGWLIKNNFPDGYRILCMNCNVSYGHTGTCPHLLERATL